MDIMTELRQMNAIDAFQTRFKQKIEIFRDGIDEEDSKSEEVQFAETLAQHMIVSYQVS